MHWIVNGFGAEAVDGLVESLADLSAVDRVYWIRDNLGEAHRTSAGKIIVIDHQAALRLNREALPVIQAPPEWTEVIRALYVSLKPVVLKMLDRLDRYGPAVSYPEREAMYRGQFGYWYGFLLEQQISAFVTSNIPHEITDFVIAELCKALQIPHLCFYQWTPDAVLPMHDYTAMGEAAARSKTALLPGEGDILERVRQRVIAAQTRPETAAPFYMVRSNIRRQQKKRERHWLQRVARKLKLRPTGLLSRSGLRYARYLTYDKKFVLPRRDAQQQREYAARARTDAAFDTPYVYLALHYQPEATTSPLGGPYVDQYLMVDVLLAAFPPEVVVYVKEHPNQRWIGRGSGYYDLFPDSPRVIFLAPSVDSAKLQQNALAVATVSGTVGFESIWKNRPVLLFGDTYYEGGPGVYRINTIEDAKAAARAVMRIDRTSDPEAALHFTESLFERLLPANIDTYYHDNSVEKLTSEHNVRVLSREIIARMAPASPPQ